MKGTLNEMLMGYLKSGQPTQLKVTVLDAQCGKILAQVGDVRNYRLNPQIQEHLDRTFVNVRIGFSENGIEIIVCEVD